MELGEAEVAGAEDGFFFCRPSAVAGMEGLFSWAVPDVFAGCGGLMGRPLRAWASADCSKIVLPPERRRAEKIKICV